MLHAVADPSTLAPNRLCGDGGLLRRYDEETNTTSVYFTVECDPVYFGELPSDVKHMYLQSYGMEHQWDIGWFTFRKTPTDRTYMMEIQHDSQEMIEWREEAPARTCGRVL